MPIPLAYFGVVLIWSTTPLAIAWSAQVAGFVFGVGSRMLLGVVLIFIFSALMRNKMVWHRKACLAYLYGGLGIYGGMLAVYWAALLIPSGWVSLLFGLTPIFSAIMASFWLEGEILTRHRISGMTIGFAGLIMIFASSLHWGLSATLGVCAVLLSSMMHSASAVWVKRVRAEVSGISMTAGSLCVATPLFILTWLLTLPDFHATFEAVSAAPAHNSLAIVYLALFGSVFGFSLYFHVLKHVEATRVALISLMTPVTSLLLGHYLNQEVITFNIIAGAVLIIAGLAVFELGGKPLPKWIPFRPN
ncbi:MAG: EamA family transporter [Zetaproteobacteria bacterium CG_4_9_14_3_um_filter_49_83]|nr:MAG: EamA family transporter [Zetaproteobacteria bacterium CG1_02_49_23]PIQ34096.1 MAG: EamA family transporter [Zetaproteobacteria bacterium CG17_big_fil_post_rev_8_21_14_2_50_50_13]PIV30227.1 MAG: EamA family transporter [Zetaproteobacteria bacterium CG02_land_8_20_14_3_00_50_9]PIY55856.1 MAG: EamA family transporter [Zetaproteobacteria bacterium CG_4_10_14_0_8_um_filter_49_80]PJA34986.1 MAG: EamA family transporter [Zetaproteobacteria bacterium CG_4_9_14_3_um_filter_49_83]